MKENQGGRVHGNLRQVDDVGNSIHELHVDKIGENIDAVVLAKVYLRR